MQIDLHMHSTYSDGSLQPQEILNLAIKNSVQVISLTDHDTILGVKKMLELDLSKIHLIKGIELDSYLKVHKRSLHILGYGFTQDLSEVQKKIQKIRANRGARNLAILEKMQKLGVHINQEELLASIHSQRATSIQEIGRPHFANYLIKKGIVGSFVAAFDEYLSAETGKAFVAREIITPQDIITIIHELGGKAFIAHPNTLNLDKEQFVKLVVELKEAGLDGIEILNASIKTHAYSFFLKQVADKYKLLYSAGSDFHGALKSNVNLGQVKQNGKIKKLTSQDISPWFLKALN